MKEYYVTLCEFYLKHNVIDYLGPHPPQGLCEVFQTWTDEKGDVYEIFYNYRFIEYNFKLRIGELSDEALQLFQKEICKRDVDFWVNNGPFIDSRIVCCGVGQKPQWNGDHTITFPYKKAVDYQKKNGVIRDDNIRYATIAIWLREYKQQSLKEQYDLGQKLKYDNATSIMRFPPSQQNTIATFSQKILKTCLDLASEIRNSEFIGGETKIGVGTLEAAQVQPTITTPQPKEEVFVDSPVPQMKKPARTSRKKNVNARLLELIMKNPDWKYQTASFFATKLNCSDSMIKQTPAWKNMMRARQSERNSNASNYREKPVTKTVTDQK